MTFRVAIALIAGLLIGALFGLQLSEGTGAGWIGAVMGAVAGLPIGVNWAARTENKLDVSNGRNEDE
ncbi:hypothetical protein [Euryhalocaulis caribicus]|uniref:hypothetical protein n=1 Tax=Euryhalocaulis caribicus TaxID=1161401 RepID=UPI0003A8790E|nr:hypothetical protein [Euryhalocaulis caribicus]